jgi:hypothetical protein
MKKVFPKFLEKDNMLNRVIEIRDARMREYLQNNRENIRQEVENICVAELDRIRRMAQQGVQPYKRLWEIRTQVTGKTSI